MFKFIFDIENLFIPIAIERYINPGISLSIYRVYIFGIQVIKFVK